MRNGRPLAHVPVSSNHLQASLLLSLLGKSSPCLKVSWQVNQRHCVLTVSSKSTVCQLTLNRPWTSLLLLFCEYNIWFLKSQFFVLKMVTVSFLCGLNVTLRGNPGVDGITLKQCYWQVMNRHHFQSFKKLEWILRRCSVQPEMERIGIHLFKVMQQTLSLYQIGYMQDDQKYGTRVWTTH